MFRLIQFFLRLFLCVFSLIYFFISGIFIAYLTAGGFYLQLFEFSTEIIDIIVAVIIYFSAFALMVKMLIGKVQKARHEKEEAQTKGGGDA